jgi:hypothetical protein
MRVFIGIADTEERKIAFDSSVRDNQTTILPIRSRFTQRSHLGIGVSTRQTAGLADSSLFLQQGERVIRCHQQCSLILVGQLDLHEQINGSPDRVQETGEREIKEP